MENYYRLEQEYEKFKKSYNIYHSVKEILKIIFILLGTLATVISVILSSVDFFDNKISSIISYIGAVQTLITVSISKILNGKLLENTIRRMINRKETKDKLFLFDPKAMDDNEISLIEMMEMRRILHANF